MRYTKNTRLLQAKKSDNIYKLTSQALKKLHAGTSISKRGGKKLWGVPGLTVMIYYVLLAYLRMRNVHDAINAGIIPLKKDIFYRFLTRGIFNWHGFYYDLVKKFIEIKGLNPGKGYFIIDDSPFEKRGKVNGFIDKIYDHISHRYIRGYTIVSLYLVVGDYTIPLDFLYSVSKNKRESMSPEKLSKKFPSDTEIAKRIELSYKQDKLHLMYWLVDKAIENRIKASKILFDSWYACKESLNFFKKQWGIEVIAGYKAGNTKFVHNGREKDIPQIIREQRHRFRRYFNKSFRGAKVTVSLQDVGNVTLIFTEKLRNNKVRTRCFISTLYGSEYSVSGLIEEYSIRWNIETSFKKLKQNYGFNNYHGKSEYGLIAHTIICYVRMLIVALVQIDFGLGFFSGIINVCVTKIGRFLERCRDNFEYAYDVVISSVSRISKRLAYRLELMATQFNSTLKDILNLVCET